MARRAHALQKLLDQVNALAPNRNKASDGWIGDAAHQAVQSDHNPNSLDIVLAQDITHDPAHGVDIQKIADAIIASKDPRIWYIIFNKRIWERGIGWRPYSGANDHTKHGHFNTVHTQSQYDSTKAWTIKKGVTMSPQDKAHLALGRKADKYNWQERIEADKKLIEQLVKNHLTSSVFKENIRKLVK